MNNDRTIVLENVSRMAIGLTDTQHRTYNLGKGAKMRISLVSLQDILDFPASKIIFKEGLCKISNITADALYSMGLSEEEIELFAPTASFEEVEEIIEEPVVEEVKEVEKPKAAPAPKKTTTTAKKSTSTKKTSTTKKK